MYRLICPLVIFLAAAAPARAAFVIADGTNPADLRRGVSVALVQVSRVHVNRARKRAHYVQYRHVDLRLIRMLYGPRPPAKGLSGIPYATVMDTAWPAFPGGPGGKYFVMAWVRGYPCGSGSAVSFSSRVSLPFHVRGPKDPWIEAIRRILRAVDQPNLTAQLKALEAAFRQTGSPPLAYLADAALCRVQSDHRHSARRFLRLLSLVGRGRGRGPLSGWALLHELDKIRPLTSPATYRRAWAGHVPRRWPFSAFRRHARQEIARLAAGTRTPTETRRNALLALARPPCFIAPGRTAGDRRAVKAIRAQLRAKVVTVRRTALAALLRVAAQVRRTDGVRAHKLLAEAKRAVRNERSAAERAILLQRVREIWKR